MDDHQASRMRSFQLKFGQKVLAVFTGIALLSILGWSVAMTQSHMAEKQQIFAHDNDATAMTFVQRESFSLLLAIKSWSTGEISGRDVQIARALLSHRLGVVVSSGKATSNLVGFDYKIALLALDPYIRGLPSVSDSNRAWYERQMYKQVGSFDSQTRLLSNTFQKISKAQSEAAVQASTEADIVQNILLMIVMFSGVGFMYWIGRDMSGANRSALAEIEEQEERLARSRKRLMIVQEMDSQSRRLISDVRRGIPVEQVVNRLTEIVYDLAPSLKVDIKVDGIDLKTFDISHAGESELNFEEMALIISRAREVLDIALARDRQIRELEVQRNFDALTGLPNRGHFTTSLETMLATVTDSGQTMGVLLLDVDRFREINNSLGYAAGDALLREVGARLDEYIETNEVAARLSADEFGVAGTYSSLEAARERARELTQKMHFHTALDGHDSAISVCAGSAFSQGGMLTSHELSRRAALAIFLAKGKGDRGAYTEYDEAVHSGLLGTWQEEIAIREALRAGEFKVYFQPIVSADDEKPVGVEALIRWERPGQGTLLPDEFLPTINRAGLATEVGNDVLIKSLECWVSTINPITEEFGGQRMYVSINTEAVQLEDAGFADFVIGTAGRLGVPLDAIVLEVTEHALSGGPTVISQLQRLRALGARVALDDFGTGYSNLGQAKNLPMDILKIDKSFLEGIEDDVKSQRMVADVTQMAKGQNLKVTVEGVESEPVRDILRTMGIHNIQGWLYSKAMPPESLASWLRDRG